ncbi:hypothetical protein DFJ73DRAFT_885265 [Zopfochytrium polystomum]|nr:hypothetical protein DFJ73DRAFT_885265 [Zopfochytrium polystomum]
MALMTFWFGHTWVPAALYATQANFGGDASSRQAEVVEFGDGGNIAERSVFAVDKTIEATDWPYVSECCFCEDSPHAPPWMATYPS